MYNKLILRRKMKKYLSNVAAVLSQKPGQRDGAIRFPLERGRGVFFNRTFKPFSMA
jgi:hypothetical protein